MKINYKKGFTLIELLVVVAIIGILAGVVLAATKSSRDKANDAKIQSQLKSMVTQAQLYNYPPNMNSVVPPPITPPTTPTNGLSNGNLFNNNVVSYNSLYFLISKLPTGTRVYYGREAGSIPNGAKWFVAASGSKGAFCIDYTGLLKKSTITSPYTTVLQFTAAFPKAIVPDYNCN